MGSPRTIDLEVILAPIPGENPAGKDARSSNVYAAIEKARRADDGLPQGDWQREAKSADWAGVVGKAGDLLTGESKDLQVAAWMVEGLVKLHGFAGLRDGLRLVRELQGRFWDSLYPPIDDGDLEPRMGRLEWINGKLPASIRGVALTRSADGEEYSWLQWKESRTVDNLARQSPEAHQAAIADGKLTGERFDKAMAGTPHAFYETLSEDLAECWEECEALIRVVDDQFGRDAPSLLDVKAALEECRGFVERIVKPKGKVESDRPAGEPTAQDTLASPRMSESRVAGSAPMGAVPLAPEDRADALRRLSAVADFFRRTEPHSPVSYLVQRAVQWGEMPLEAWLGEVINDSAVLARVRETLGLKEQETS